MFTSCQELGQKLPMPFHIPPEMRTTAEIVADSRTPQGYFARMLEENNRLTTHALFERCKREYRSNVLMRAFVALCAAGAIAIIIHQMFIADVGQYSQQELGFGVFVLVLCVYATYALHISAERYRARLGFIRGEYDRDMKTPLVLLDAVLKKAFVASADGFNYRLGSALKKLSMADGVAWNALREERNGLCGTWRELWEQQYKGKTTVHQC